MFVHLQKPLDTNVELVRIPFGSHCYGTAKFWSDKDYLVLTEKDTGDLILRYTDEIENNDLTYVGIKSFWNTMHTDAEQVYFEAAHTPEFKKFYEDRFQMKFEVLDFYTKRAARMYIGYAKRDLKQDGFGRAKHITRCLYIAEKILNKSLIKLEDIGKLEIETNIEKLTEKMNSMRQGIINGL